MIEITEAMTVVAIAHWYQLARDEEAQREYDVATFGHSPNSYNARIRLYRETARAMRLGLETGEPHCACHLMTAEERRLRGINP